MYRYVRKIANRLEEMDVVASTRAVLMLACMLCSAS